MNAHADAAPSAPEPPPFTNSGLFSNHLLQNRMQGHPAWLHWTDAECARLHGELSRLLKAYTTAMQQKNEEDTRNQWLDKVICLLGFEYSREVPLGGGRIDYVLFADQDAKAGASAATKEGAAGAGYPFALSILEAKYWGRSINGRVLGSDDAADHENPVMQINRYLDNAHILSNNAVQWAVLTNGQNWRLYWRGAHSRAFTHFELDLVDLMQAPHRQEGDWARFRLFPLFFSKNAFVRSVDGRCLLDELREAARAHAIHVGDSLESAIYGPDGAYATLARGLHRAAAQAGAVDTDESPFKDLGALETYTLALLYRLLFLLYAEDRDLLPMGRADYYKVSLKKIRTEIAGAVDSGSVPKGRAATYWGRLKTLFDLMDGGDPELDLPYYNGGLFDAETYPLFKALDIPDPELMPALDALSRVAEGGARLMVDFKDLGVKQLGSLYEGLLEYSLTPDGGTVAVSRDSLARKTSASYYTNEDLVAFLVEETMAPVLEERKEKARALMNDWVKHVERLEDKSLDFHVKSWIEGEMDQLSRQMESALLDIKVLDPAMGSGHFLVSALNFLADGVMGILAEHQDDESIRSRLDEHPILKMLAAQRKAILDSLRGQGITLEAYKGVAGRLSDMSLLKRVLMKRCLFGVDLTPMAVELAKLSLWLDSFTLGAPLTFLDHHLKCGNSLLGASLDDYRKAVYDSQGGEAQSSIFTKMPSWMPEDIIDELKQVAVIADATREQVRQSSFLYYKAEKELQRGRLIFDVALSRSFSNKPTKVGKGKGQTLTDDARALLVDTAGIDMLCAVAQGAPKAEEDLTDLFRACTLNTLKDSKNHSFFHWELAFPAVLMEGEGLNESGDLGFDAIVTNPPWERIKLQENEFFAKTPVVAGTQTQAKRKAAMARLPQEDPALWQKYQRAKRLREEMLDYCHAEGSPYPLLGGGDTNLYSLMVERALTLIKKNGRAGFVVPTGICMDKGGSEFFGQIVKGHRLCFVYDFENRRKQFPSVDSRFKFCLIGFAGTDGNGSKIPTAFFLHGTEQIRDRSIYLDRDDFELMNPNTKTCPTFRSDKDYGITKRIYERVPILHRHAPDENPWGVTYKRLFDMTNDSGLFRTQAELESMGAWPETGRPNGHAPEENPWGIRYKTLFHMTNDSGLFRTQVELDGMGAWPDAGPLPTYGSPEGRYVPLLEGKMINHWNPRYAGIKVNLDNIHHKSTSSASDRRDLMKPSYFPKPQFWVPESELLKKLPSSEPWLLALRAISNPTNVRTLIAAAIPLVAVGNSLSLLLVDASQHAAHCLLANLNSLVLDYIVRQKIGGQNLNLYLLEQLPTLPPDFYSSTLHGRTWESLVAPRAFELSYTCDALGPMAAAYGHGGPPFGWDEDRRLALQAQLDALFLLAYGFASQGDEPDIAHILDSFPILRKDAPKYAGLVMGYVRAYRAGALDAAVGG
jgi:hypothetical protein